MGMILSLAKSVSRRARARRAELFRSRFDLREHTRILDLGSEDGSHIHSVLAGTPIRRENVYIADIRHDLVARGQAQYGFTPVVVDESGRLPFPDRFFDIVHCSSVIEHVTLPKAQVWHLKSGTEFRSVARCRQREFALEIRRVAAQYFVQTPNRSFLIESHSWLPFLGVLPRERLIPLLQVTNRFWVKKTAPDWHLLDAREMCALFEDADIVAERVCGMAKSLIAVRTDQSRRVPDSQAPTSGAAPL